MGRKRISVYQLSKMCPVFLKLSLIAPVEETKPEIVVGRWLHEILAACVRGVPLREALISLKRKVVKRKNDRGSYSRFFMLPETKRWLEMLAQNGCSFISQERKRWLKVYSEIPVSVEVDVGGTSYTIVGRIDAVAKTREGWVIYDWKSGSYRSEEHRMQMEIYRWLLWKGRSKFLPVVSGKVVYLGDISKNGEVEIVEWDGRDGIAELEGEIRNLFASLSGWESRFSSACVFCPYRYVCVTMRGLSELGEEIEISRVSDPISDQLRRLARMYRRIAGAFTRKEEEIMRLLEKRES